MPDSLTSLAIAALHGDGSAWQDLYEAVTPGLYSLLEAKTSQADAEEIVLMTWEKIFLKFHTFNPDYGFRTWAFTIALNTLRDRMRRKKHDFVPVGDLSWCDEPSMLPADDQDFEQHVQRLSECIESLAPQERRIVRLRYWEGKSHIEIAEMLGQRSPQIRAKCHRTVRKLATCMGH